MMYRSVVTAVIAVFMFTGCISHTAHPETPQHNYAFNVSDVYGHSVIAPDATEVVYRVKLDNDEVSAEDISSLQVKIIETNVDGSIIEKTSVVAPDLTITHALREGQQIDKIDVFVYLKGLEDRGVSATTHIRALHANEITNARPDNGGKSHISTIGNEIYTMRADTSLAEGTEVLARLLVIGTDGSTLATVERATTVQSGKIEQPFDIAKIIDEYQLDYTTIDKFRGQIVYEKP